MLRNKQKIPQVLTIGGLDPTGGAGILLDARAVAAAGAHPAAAVTTIAVQRNTGFVASHVTLPEPFRETVDAVLASAPIGAVKTGALGNGNLVRTVAEVASETEFPPLIVDPVFSSTTGGTLLEPEGVAVLLNELLPKTSLITPNLLESERLLSFKVETVDDMKRAAEQLLQLGPESVLIKGGHLDSHRVVDVFQDAKSEPTLLDSPRIGTGEVRGTGCALASLIAAFIARKFEPFDAITQAKEILTGAIRSSVCVGPGPRFLRFD